MNRWVKWGTFTLGMIILAGLVSQVVISQQPAASTRSDPRSSILNPQSSILDLPSSMFEPLRPHLEAVLGTRLETVPRVYVVTTAQLARVPDADVDAHLHWHFPALRNDKSLAAALQVAQQVTASAVIARHIEGTDVIVVVPEALPRIARWDESLAAIDKPALLQLAVIHETVRFLLDHRCNLGKLRQACCDGEEYQALLSVVLGRAQSVTRKVAARLGHEEDVALLTRRYLFVPDEAPDPGLRAVSQTALRDRQRACIAGENFFAVLEEANLGDVESYVFARLPRQERTIARPDLWLRALNTNRADLRAVFHALDKANVLPATQWQTLEQTWTPAMLSQVAAMLGAPRERVDKLAATWDEGRSLICCNRQHPDQQVVLSAVRHESGAGARAYFGFAVELQRKQDTLPPGSCGSALRIVESQSTAIPLDGFDEAVRNDKKIQYGAGSEPLPAHLLLARAGDLVVECTWHGAGTEAALAEQLVQAVRAAAK